MASVGQRPFQSGCIVQALREAFRKLCVGNAEKIAASLVKPDADILMQVGMQLARVLQPYLVKHAPEVDDAADLFVRAAWIFHVGKDG